MRKIAAVISLCLTAALGAEGNISFRIGTQNYELSGAHGLLARRKGKTQLVIAVKDTQHKTQFALTAELPADLTGPMELTPDVTPLTVVIVNARGIYSFVPHVTLSRDDFMRYTKKEEIATGEMEDDPEDRPEERLEECRRGNLRDCLQAIRQKRRRRPKIKVRYTKHAPTWVGKTREERIAQGDGVAVEEKYRDTSLIVRINPVLVNGKVTSLTGSFAGVMVYNEGMNSAKKIPLQGGAFSVTVKGAE
ncbi:MAG: hypothetical protein OHK0011_01670 [Turneriella sp.]